MTISHDSAQAREAARHSDGTFGEQHLPEPDALHTVAAPAWTTETTIEELLGDDTYIRLVNSPTTPVPMVVDQVEVCTRVDGGYDLIGSRSIDMTEVAARLAGHDTENGVNVDSPEDRYLSDWLSVNEDRLGAALETVYGPGAQFDPAADTWDATAIQVTHTVPAGARIHDSLVGLAHADAACDVFEDTVMSNDFQDKLRAAVGSTPIRPPEPRVMDHWCSTAEAVGDTDVADIEAFAMCRYISATTEPGLREPRLPFATIGQSPDRVNRRVFLDAVHEQWKAAAWDQRRRRWLDHLGTWALHTDALDD